MTPTVQTKLAPPDGNCMQACVASLFDLPLEDVPNFMTLPSWWRALWEWAEPRGWNVLMWREGGLDSLSPGAWSSLGIASIAPTGARYRHCVLMSMGSGLLVMDPYPGAEQDRQLDTDEIEYVMVFVKIGP